MKYTYDEINALEGKELNDAVARADRDFEELPKWMNKYPDRDYRNSGDLIDRIAIEAEIYISFNLVLKHYTAISRKN